MAFTSVCKLEALREGAMETFPAEEREVLVVWPRGGSPMAFQSTCPHGEFPLSKGRFTGRVVMCRFHQSLFDASTGKGIYPRGCDLREYPVRLQNGEVQVELALGTEA
jgi:toluene monooxygenase system ferredoxin subunit